MDMAQLQRLIEWVEANVGERVSKSELLARTRDTELPQEAKLAVRSLPEGEWTRDDLLDELRRISRDELGAGMGASTAGMKGGGGIFGE